MCLSTSLTFWAVAWLAAALLVALGFAIGCQVGKVSALDALLEELDTSPDAD